MKRNLVAAVFWAWIDLDRPNWNGTMSLSNLARGPLLALPLFLLLGGCVTTGGGSVAGGECKVFEAPKYAIRGATQYDQDWADSTVEGGVGGCHWQRPAVRPAELDATQAPKPVAKPVKKRTLAARVKAKIWPVKAAPVLETPLAPAPPPPAPPAPRSVIDELLHPNGAL